MAVDHCDITQYCAIIKWDMLANENQGVHSECRSNDFYPITHSSTQEHGTWKWNCYCQQEMGVELKSRLLLTVERVMVCVRGNLAIVFICHLIVNLYHVIWGLHEELFSKWQGYSKQYWWQIFSDRRPREGRKILAYRPLRQKGRTLPMAAIARAKRCNKN